jgi:anti-sigma-K factor RskA
MTHDHDRYRDSIPAYVLGALDEEEREALERHLEGGCDGCEAEMLLASRDLEALAATHAPVEPAATTRARLLHTVRETAAPRPRGLNWVPLAAAATLALLAWSGWTQIELRREVERLTADREATEVRMSGLRADLERARRRLDRYAAASRILAAPGLETVRLAGLEAAPEASAQALVAGPGGKAVFYASNLAAPGPGRTYQLWVIVAGSPVSAGVFDVEADGSGSLIVDSLAEAEKVEAWAVTLEPAGGVAQPTGPMVLMGATA